jgi:hypothetical protein
MSKGSEFPNFGDLRSLDRLISSPSLFQKWPESLSPVRFSFIGEGKD